MKAIVPVLLFALAGVLLDPGLVQAQADDEQVSGSDRLRLEELSSRWSAARTRWSESGLTFEYDTTYILQGVAAGGVTGPRFSKYSNETEIGNTFSGDLRGTLDTEQAGWWTSGTFSARLQSRAGRSAVQRAGSVAAVNNEALFPNVIDRFDQAVLALTEFAYEHKLSDTVSVYGGLLNTSMGDENAIAGSAQSHSHFLNFAMLYSAVEDATTGNAALGAGVNILPSESVSGSFSVYGSQETAGENPFRNWHGTTLSTEWTIQHTLRERPGAQTFGFLYGINVLLTDIAADPRLVLIDILSDLPIPAITTNTWAFYYNAHQFIEGDEEGGWGFFVRWGVSDGDPNLIRQNAALGAGGVGLFPTRPSDRWGAGVFLMDVTTSALLRSLRVRDEVGAEAYYDIAVSPSFHVTLDAQLIDPGLPRSEFACVLGLRANYHY